MPTETNTRALAAVGVNSMAAEIAAANIVLCKMRVIFMVLSLSCISFACPVVPWTCGLRGLQVAEFAGWAPSAASECLPDELTVN